MGGKGRSSHEVPTPASPTIVGEAEREETAGERPHMPLPRMPSQPDRGRRVFGGSVGMGWARSDVGLVFGGIFLRSLRGRRLKSRPIPVVNVLGADEEG
jgi:hypothetical protein